jgi:hypothetical protein
LRTALWQHPEVLAGINFEASKREVADEVVDCMMQDEHLYRDTTLRLMMEVANLLRFPELERHEDSDRLLKQATDAVAELKRHTEAHEQLIIESERLEAERTAYLQQAELQRRFADELEKLKVEFLRLTALGEEYAQQRGRDFEPFSNRLFDLFDLEPRLSYNFGGEADRRRLQL